MDQSLGRRFTQGPLRNYQIVFYQPKLCSKCQYYIASPHSVVFDRCSLYKMGTDGFDMRIPDMEMVPMSSHMQPPSGVIPNYMLCQEVRERPDMCGRFGKDYRPKSLSETDGPVSS